MERPAKLLGADRPLAYSKGSVARIAGHSCARFALTLTNGRGPIFRRYISRFDGKGSSGHSRWKHGSAPWVDGQLGRRRRRRLVLGSWTKVAARYTSLLFYHPRADRWVSAGACGMGRMSAMV